MKRLLFIFAILIVLGIVGFYSFMEFSAPEISFVTDTKNISARGNEMVLHRLYTSGIDIDEFFEKVESSLITAEFSEDEIYTAALASGTPEFFPAFYFNLYYYDSNEKKFNFNGQVRQEFTSNQTNANFNITNLHLEVITEGIAVENVETVIANSDVKSMNTPIISEDKRSMAIGLDNVQSFSFDFTGNGGRATFQFTYDIITSSIFPNIALTEQLLIVYANIFVSEEGVLSVEYINEPYSSLEDYE